MELRVTIKKESSLSVDLDIRVLVEANRII